MDEANVERIRKASEELRYCLREAKSLVACRASRELVEEAEKQLDAIDQVLWLHWLCSPTAA